MEFLIEDFKVQKLQNGKYLTPYFATFKLNGQKRDWEIIKSSDSVAILIYNKDNDSFVCVKQFRPPVYLNSNAKFGVTVELCAGILDKNLSLEEIAAEEILEETGYKVEPSNLQKITSFFTSVGSSGARQHLYYCEVTNSNKVSSGGGVEGEEQIEVVEIKVDSARDFMFNENIAKTPGLLFAFSWFFLKENR